MEDISIGMEVICLEDSAINVLIEKVVERIKGQQGKQENKWISGAEAIKKLRITSKTTLQKLREEGKIGYSQHEKKILLYDVYSIRDYIEDFIEDPLTMAEEQDPSPEYIKGFNQMYKLKKEMPEVAQQLLSAEGERFKSMVAGARQHELDRIRNVSQKIQGQSQEPKI